MTPISISLSLSNSNHQFLHLIPHLNHNMICLLFPSKLIKHIGQSFVNCSILYSLHIRWRTFNFLRTNNSQYQFRLTIEYNFWKSFDDGTHFYYWTPSNWKLKTVRRMNIYRNILKIHAISINGNVMLMLKYIYLLPNDKWIGWISHFTNVSRLKL